VTVQLPWLVTLGPIGKFLRLEKYRIEEAVVNVRRQRMVATYGRVRDAAPQAERIHGVACLDSDPSGWESQTLVIVVWK